MLFIATLAMAQGEPGGGLIDLLNDKFVLVYALFTSLITFASPYIPFLNKVDIRLRNVLIAVSIWVAIWASGVSLSEIDIIIGFIIQKIGYEQVAEPLGIKTKKAKVKTAA